MTHEEDLSDFLSMSVLLSQPPSCPAQAAARDAYLATLDFVEALCETSSSLTRFPPVCVCVCVERGLRVCRRLPNLLLQLSITACCFCRHQPACLCPHTDSPLAVA